MKNEAQVLAEKHLVRAALLWYSERESHSWDRPRRPGKDCPTCDRAFRRLVRAIEEVKKL